MASSIDVARIWRTHSIEWWTSAAWARIDGGGQLLALWGPALLLECSGCWRNLLRARELRARPRGMVEAADSKPRGWERWGLGPSVKHSSKHFHMPEELAVQLLELNESRKTLYHFGHSEADASLSRATSAYVQEVGSETQ